MQIQKFFPWRLLNRNLRLLALALLFWALGDGLFYGFLPLQARRLGASDVQVGNLMAAYVLIQALVVLPSGIAADRFNLKRLMQFSWWIGVTGVIFMTSGLLSVFSCGLAIFGVSFMFAPPTNRYITLQRGELSPQRAFTLVYSAFTVGMILSPWVGGWMAQHFGLQTNFRVAVILLAISSLIIGLLQAIPATHGEDQPHWSDFLTLLRQPQFSRYILVMFFSMLVFHLGMTLSPNFLQERWAVSDQVYGVLGSIMAFGGLLVHLRFGNHHPRLMVVALLLMASVYCAISLLTGNVIWLGVAYFFRSGFIIVRDYLDALTSRIASAHQYGSAFAVSLIAYLGASVLANALAGQLYARNPALPFWISAICLPFAALVCWYLLPHEKPSPTIVHSSNDVTL